MRMLATYTPISFRKIAFGISILFSFNSCFEAKFVLDDNFNYIPKEYEFKFSEDLLSYNGEFLVDTNAIYIQNYIPSLLDSSEDKSSVHFIRFFPDGQYFSSRYYPDSLTDFQMNSISNGNIGFYTFKNGEVIVESYSSIESGKYFLTKYRLEGNNLIQYKQKVNCWYCKWMRRNNLFEYSRQNTLYHAAYW